jgi:predicted Zn-dependent protease
MRAETFFMPARLLFVAAVFAGTAACVTNPVTGKRQLTSVSAEEEARAGAQAHPKIIAAFGGVYDDPAIGVYVAQVAGQLAKASGRAVSYRVTVLDSPVVNAFALPGGYVYVTRGLLALVDDEAQLASVLGHEIGHVDARHSAQRQTAAMGASVLGAVLGAVVGSQAVSQVVGMGGQGLLASYSRDQEYEADALGVNAITLAGYDPYASAAFLEKMGAEEAVNAQIAKAEREGSKADWLASHPATPDRVSAAKTHAAETGVQSGLQSGRRREPYLDAINGMIYGDSPLHGMVRGRDFVHSVQGFAFTAPRGFTLINTPQAVGIQGANKTIAKFDAVQKSAHLDIETYLVSGWGAQVQLSSVSKFSIGGFRAASAWTRIGSYDARLVAIEFSPTDVYRFLIGVLPQARGTHEEALDQMVLSFRRLIGREAAEAKPYRIRIVTVAPGETVGELASRMALPDLRELRFRVLNGLSAEAKLLPGQRVKLIMQ